MKKFIAKFTAITLFLCAPLCSAQLVVVVGAKSSATTLTKDQAEALFLGKSFALPGAGIPLLIDLPESAPARSDFYMKLSGKSATQVKSIWMRLVFSGKGVPPTEAANSNAVKKIVSTNMDAIGYIEKSAVDDTVKVLFSIE